MGLNFSHCNAHWGYFGFMRFRKRLAAMIGELAYLDQQSAFNWDACNDPIKDLLLHSDCDGELSVEQMKVIMPRLKEMVAPWPEGDLDREKAFELVGGMELAISNNEPLAFS